MLRRGNQSDANKLAEIHLGEFSSNFLPRLGEKFLRLLYVNLLEDKNTYIWIACTSNHTQGFIVGSKDFSAVFKKIITHNIVQFAFLIIPAILKKPTILINIIETFFYPKKEGSHTPEAELVIIAVLKKYQRRGLGKRLVQALEKDLLAHGIRKYKVSMNTKNSGANSFYEALGFKKSHEFILYREKVTLFIKNI